MNRQIKPDRYLQEIIEFLKKKHKKDLIAVMIHGSYAWGYFDPDKSDYDLFLIFNKKVGIIKQLKEKFPKAKNIYSYETEELKERIKKGGFSTYIAILKGAKVLYKTKKLNSLLKEIGRIDPLEHLTRDKFFLKKKITRKKHELRVRKNFEANKRAFYIIAEILRVYNYLKTKRLVWEVPLLMELNSDILTKRDKDFVKLIQKRINKRSELFSQKVRNQAMGLINKISNIISIQTKKVQNQTTNQ